MRTVPKAWSLAPGPYMEARARVHGAPVFCLVGAAPLRSTTTVGCSPASPVSRWRAGAVGSSSAIDFLSRLDRLTYDTAGRRAPLHDDDDWPTDLHTLYTEYTDTVRRSAS